MYLIEGLDGDAPSGRMVASFPQKPGTSCAIPVVSGDYYLVTVPAWRAVVSLDISTPSAPREVSRVTLDEGDVPHWIAIAPDGRRVVITGYAGLQHRALIATFDPATGQLSMDERFREEGAAAPGFRMDNKTWPHGGNAKGVPHGAVLAAIGRTDSTHACTAAATRPSRWGTSSRGPEGVRRGWRRSSRDRRRASRAAASRGH